MDIYALLMVCVFAAAVIGDSGMWRLGVELGQDALCVVRHERAVAGPVQSPQSDRHPPPLQ